MGLAAALAFDDTPRKRLVFRTLQGAHQTALYLDSDGLGFL
jgi:hypothetical protein